MSEKIEKPDKAYIKALIKRAQDTDLILRTIPDSLRGDTANLRKAADNFYNRRVMAELEKMDVDILAQGKQGIRVATLRSAGYNNIKELSSLSVLEIERIDGIGEQSAKRIADTVRQILENTKAKLSLRINPDSPRKEDELLVRALYTLIRHKELIPEAQDIYKAQHKPLRTEVSLAEKASGLSWLFASKSSKEQIASACGSLQSRVEEICGNGGVVAAFQRINSADITECLADFRENSPLYYATLEEYCKHLNTKEQESTGLSEQLTREIESHPIDLKYMKATLRSYQTFGVKYAVHQKRTLLGDEMGLGKTIQAIAAMAALKAEGKHHFMVVCPASVLINWQREIEKHSTLSVTKVHGGDEISLRHWRENGDVAVTTYESISRFELPEKFTFDMLVVDEAHYVKNPEAQRTQAMQKLLKKTDGVLYMSGTPLVNRVDEMCFLISCLQPQLMERVEAVKNVSTAEQFRQEIAPVYLRRVRKDVLKELPDLIEKAQWCELGAAEKQVYGEAVMSSNLMAIRQVSWQMPNLKDSSKAQRLLQICDSAKEEGRKIIVFSFFRNTLNKVVELLGDRCTPIISGDISPDKRQEIVDEFNRAPEGAVLVSQVQAGGTGLNIQAASVVVFCEPQLTPAIENQAVSRAYRMGQQKDVLVYRLLADDTIDERMLEILSGKQKEFVSFADESVIGEEHMELEESGEGSWITRMVQEEQKRLSAKASS